MTTKEEVISAIDAYTVTVALYISQSLEVATVAEAKVDKPLEELPKLMHLIRAHVTKLGIVFKGPVDPANYHACSTELEGSMKTQMLLVSIMKQLIAEKAKYSGLLVDQLVSRVKILLQNYEGFLSQAKDNVNGTKEEDTDKDSRLVYVGKLWNCCETIQTEVKTGSSGLLKAQLKQWKALISDALSEYEEWMAEPTTEERELIEFAKTCETKLKLVKLLVGSLDKSIPPSEYTVEYSGIVDVLKTKGSKLSEKVDDVVGSVIYDEDLDEAEESDKELDEEVGKVCELVKKINKGKESRIRWIDMWKAKYES